MTFRLGIMLHRAVVVKIENYANGSAMPLSKQITLEAVISFYIVFTRLHTLE